MENLKELLEKIENGCSLCKAKLCGSCPNSRRKKKIKEDLKKLGQWVEEPSLLEKIKKIFKK